MEVKVESSRGVHPNDCVLCRQESDEEIFGKFFVNDSGYSVHQYCLFFSSGLAQRGRDDEGFDGFLMNDIRKEVSRAKRLRCFFCKVLGASIGCSQEKCKRKFHYKCGKANGALFQFFGCFNSYCVDHRPTQCISLSRITNQTCPICLNDLDWNGSMYDVPVATPCCNNSWFHHECLQRQARSSGLYYFRCPVCNNIEKFQEEMKRMGIFIPEQDASWEQGDAFADLLFRYNCCDAAKCVCPHGREHSELSGKWRIRLCDFCGQFGTHLKCQNWKRAPTEWHCNTCGNIVPYSSTNGHPGDQSLVSEDGDSCSSSGEDREVHVCSDSEDDLPLILMKRGVDKANVPPQCSDDNTVAQTVAGPSPQRKRPRLSPRLDRARAEVTGCKESPTAKLHRVDDGFPDQAFDIFDSTSMTSSLLLAVSDIFNRAVRKLGISPNTSPLGDGDVKIKIHKEGNSTAEHILIRDTDSECSLDDVDLLTRGGTQVHQGDNKDNEPTSNIVENNYNTDSNKTFVKAELNCSYTEGEEHVGEGDSSRISKFAVKESGDSGAARGELKSKDFSNGNLKSSKECDDDDDSCIITKVVKRPCPLGNDKFGTCFLRCCKPLGYCCSNSQLALSPAVSISPVASTSENNLHGTISGISSNYDHSHSSKVKETDSSETNPSKRVSVEFCSVGTNTPPSLKKFKDVGNQTHFSYGKKSNSLHSKNTRLKSKSCLERLINQRLVLHSTTKHECNSQMS